MTAGSPGRHRWTALAVALAVALATTLGWALAAPRPTGAQEAEAGSLAAWEGVDWRSERMLTHNRRRPACRRGGGRHASISPAGTGVAPRSPVHVTR
ncbi:MAG: hypothetical protein ACJ79S_13440, partial [Gemmatimonadaceae bacterium]